MVKVTDYAIIQRDEYDEAKVYFSGTIPMDSPATPFIYGRVFGEDDNLPITALESCEIQNDKWKIEFTVPAGGLYCFEARMTESAEVEPYHGRRIAIVRHFGVGDLYLLTGQSNMAGYGRDAAYDPPALGVHLYKNNGKWDIASHPLNDSLDTIYPENREDGSATSPALSFGRILKEKLNVPIGLVQASLGGSPLSRWHPEEEASLYNGMMRRIPVVGKVKGVIWYQGCSDANEECCHTYYDRFKRMVELWRGQLGNIPVITVQLNRWAGNLSNDDTVRLETDRYWGIIRDAQRRIAVDVTGVCIVPSMDLPMSDGIHNNSGANTIIGYRMAMAAMKFIYGRTGQAAPEPRSVKYIDRTHLEVTVDPCFRMFTMDDTAHGIDVEDSSGIIPCKKATAGYGRIVLETERPYSLPAKFHAYWRTLLPSLFIKDYVGMPMLACYNMEILE